MTFTVNIFLAFHNLFMMLVHMEVHLKGYFLMRIQYRFSAGRVILELYVVVEYTTDSDEFVIETLLNALKDPEVKAHFIYSKL